MNIDVVPPDVNKSNLIFSPDALENKILYGLKGINRIGTALVQEIMNNRPYDSIEDFLNKVKINKTQMVYLIKSGAFDTLYANDRDAVMRYYLSLIADKKKRITLQNMQMLITKNLVPKELEFEVRVFNFNKYIKKAKDENYYYLDTIAMVFYTENFNTDLLVGANIGEQMSAKLPIKAWDNIYQQAMNPVRAWMKANQTEILDELNYTLYNETFEKYGKGDINSWDMDALGTYCHDHELKNLKMQTYNITPFEYLLEEPVVERSFRTEDGATINMFEISRICGTVIDKDKNKSTVVLLTPEMNVVNVKVWKNQYAKWDKQIAQRNPDGTKTIIEKSFFAKGNKLIITGIRRGDDFVPKKYKSTPFPLFEKIEEMDVDGYITKSTTERAEAIE